MSREGKTLEGFIWIFFVVWVYRFIAAVAAPLEIPIAGDGPCVGVFDAEGKTYRPTLEHSARQP
jgi:hypothetical protein